jgi:Deoxycytidylate deaminase
MRITKDDYYLGIALAVSKRSTCLKRRQGCVIVKNDIIVATGYNGNPRNNVNCIDVDKCNRPEGRRNKDYELCDAVHAEQNALLAINREQSLNATLYLACETFLHGGVNFFYEDEKAEPCGICFGLIKNAGIKKVITKKGIIWESSMK